jgi:hypothetical protein
VLSLRAAVAKSTKNTCAAAQKLLQSHAAETNRIQREFLSNGGIAPFHTFLASSHPRQKTNLFKPNSILQSWHRKIAAKVRQK